MSQNRQLAIWVASLFMGAVILTGVVIAGDLGIVDHLFDFHLDMESIIDQVHKEAQSKKDREARCQQWSNDIRDFYSSEGTERGTIGPPDRDN